MNKRVLVASLPIFLALLAVFVVTCARADAGQDYARNAAATLVGTPAPSLQFKTIDGKSIDLGAYAGKKAVYLKLWATWCSYCRQQMPHFENAFRTAGSDLEVIAVNIGINDSLEQIRSYQKEAGLTMPIVRDDGRIGRAFGLRVTPQHVVIGRDGRIQYIGHLINDELEQALAQARTGSSPVQGKNGPVTATTGVDIVKAGDAVASLSIQAPDGGLIPLADPARRQETMVVFMVPWCEGYFAKTRPQASLRCHELAERLARDTYSGSSRRWILVVPSIWASEQEVEKYRRKNRLSIPVALDLNNSLMRSLGIADIPSVAVIGKDGRLIRIEHRG